MRLALFFLVLFPCTVLAQHAKEDSLRTLLHTQLASTSRVEVLNTLAYMNLSHSLDSVVRYSTEGLTLSQNISYKKGEAEAYKNLGVAYYLKGKYQLGLNQFVEALKLSEEIGDPELIARIRHNIGGIYFSQESYKLAVDNIVYAYKMAIELGDSSSMATEQLSLCSCFDKLKEPNRAIYYCEQALKYFSPHQMDERITHAYHYLGKSYLQLGQIDQAKYYFWRSKRRVEEFNFYSVGGDLFRDMGDLYTQQERSDSSRYYYRKAATILAVYDNKQSLKQLFHSQQLYFEKQKRQDSALYYSKQYASILQHDFKSRVEDQLSSVQAYYELALNKNQLKLSKEEVNYRNTIIVAISLVVLVLALSLVMSWRFYLLKKTANLALANLNNTITNQAAALQVANEEIRHINENLEVIVDERTEEIQKKNEILVEYSHSNAHKVRGPLARILGLLHIIELTIHDKELRGLTDRMHESALELDDVVREINQLLEE